MASGLRCGAALVVTSLALPLALAGCGAREHPATHLVDDPAPVARAGWDPAYWRALGNSVEGTGRAPEGVYDNYFSTVREVMLLRTTSDDYWQLVGLLLKHAPDADYLILAEGLSYFQDHYWFGLTVIKGDRAWRYASAKPPIEFDGEVPITPRPWGEVDRAGQMRAVVGAFGRAGGWGSDSRGWTLASTHPEPWLIHVYGRREGAVSFVITEDLEPLIQTEVALSERPLDAVIRSADQVDWRSQAEEENWFYHLLQEEDDDGDDGGLFGEGDEELEERGPTEEQIAARAKALEERGERFHEYVEDSYPARLALNGMLRVIYSPSDD